MKSSKVIHHPGKDGEKFSTVEDEIEDLNDNKITGPASATGNAVARFDGTTGKLIKDSGVAIDDSNNVSGVATLTATTVAGTNVTKGGANVAKATQTFSLTVIIEAPEDGDDYILWINIPFAGTIVETATVCEDGSCTATVFTGDDACDPNSVSIVMDVVAQEVLFDVGDTIGVAIDDVVDCERMTLSINYTRTLE